MSSPPPFPPQELLDLGYGIVATAGTKAALDAGGCVGVESVLKIQEGRPNAGDLMVNREITMVLITTTGAFQCPSPPDGLRMHLCVPTFDTSINCAL